MHKHCVPVTEMLALTTIAGEKDIQEVWMEEEGGRGREFWVQGRASY